MAVPAWLLEYEFYDDLVRIYAEQAEQAKKKEEDRIRETQRIDSDPVWQARSGRLRYAADYILTLHHAELTDCEDTILRLKWKAHAADTSNGGYNHHVIREIFREYGELCGVGMSRISNGSAVVEFKSSASAREVFRRRERGKILNPLTVTWLKERVNYIALLMTDDRHFEGVLCSWCVRHCEKQRIRKLEEEALRKLEDERLKKLEEERLIRVEEERLIKLEEERLNKIEEERLKKLEEERLKKLEEERLIRVEEERLIKLEEERLNKIEEERLKKLEEERLKELEKERLIKLEEERLIKLEEERLKKIEEERLKKLEEERLRKLERERLRKLETERLIKLAEERVKNLEEERLRKLEEERLWQLDEELLKKIEVLHSRKGRNFITFEYTDYDNVLDGEERATDVEEVPVVEDLDHLEQKNELKNNQEDDQKNEQNDEQENNLVGYNLDGYMNYEKEDQEEFYDPNYDYKSDDEIYVDYVEEEYDDPVFELLVNA